MQTREAIEQQEEAIRERVNRLPDGQRLEFYRRSERQLKDPDTYAALNWLFIAGLHHFYLRRWLRGLVNLAIFCGGIALVLTGMITAGTIVLLAITAVELYALFNSQNIVAEYNNAVMEKIHADLNRHINQDG